MVRKLHCSDACQPYQLTITQKMADQGRSDLDVAFATILCAINFLFGKLWSSYSQISFKYLLRAHTPNIKAVRFEISNFLTIVLIQVRKDSW